MYIHVLGSAAGGGFPQWNCNCENCHGVRQGTIDAHTRTQSSIAISENGTDWILFNASLTFASSYLTLKPLSQPVNYETQASPMWC